MPPTLFFTATEPPPSPGSENIRKPLTTATRPFATTRATEKVTHDNSDSVTFDFNLHHFSAYGRLGLAFSKMNRHQEAIDAYKNAIRIEPDNQDYKNNMEVTQQRMEEQEQAGTAPPGLGALGAGLGGLGGAGGLDFAAALNNPALVNMATQMMFVMLLRSLNPN